MANTPFKLLTCSQVIANNGATSPQLFVATIASSPFVPPEYHWDDYVIAVSDEPGDTS
jgi:hypothetical protein